MRLYRLAVCVCLLTFAVASCAGPALQAIATPLSNRLPILLLSGDTVGAPQNANASSNQNDKSDQAVLSLDLQNPQITQKIRPDDGDPAKARFVQVEVIKIENPQKRPAQFDVYYQPNDGEKILLGVFSLYPPDNPGKFIVPTQGKVKADGKLILSLMKSDRVEAGDVVKVDIHPMKFVNR